MAQFEYKGNKLSSGIEEYSVGKHQFKCWTVRFYERNNISVSFLPSQKTASLCFALTASIDRYRKKMVKPLN